MIHPRVYLNRLKLRKYRRKHLVREIQEYLGVFAKMGKFCDGAQQFYDADLGMLK